MERDNLSLLCFMAKYTHTYKQHNRNNCASVSIPLVCPVWILMVSWWWFGVPGCESSSVFSFDPPISYLAFFSLSLYLSGEGLCWACMHVSAFFHVCILTHLSTSGSRAVTGDCCWPQSGHVTSHGDCSERAASFSFTFPARFLHTHTHAHTLT